MKSQKFLPFFLLVITLLCLLLTSCNGGDGEEAEGEEKQDSPYSASYDGYEFVIGWANDQNFNEVWASEDEGETDSLSKVIFDRNKQAEEKLQVSISAINTCAANKSLEALYAATLSEDTRYDVFCGPVAVQYMASVSGYLQDLSDHVNADNSWWDASLNEAFSLGSEKQYFISGDMNLLTDAATHCLAMNKGLCFSCKIEFPYEDVKDGTWTLDNFHTIISEFSVDLNSNRKWDENDRYSVAVNGSDVFAFLSGLDASVIRVENGIPSLSEADILSSGFDSLFEMLFDKDNEDIKAATKLSGGNVLSFFSQGQTLFASATLGDIQNLAASTGKVISALPYPKATEEQTAYASSLNAETATAFSLVRNCPNPSRAGNILDTMGSFNDSTSSMLGIDDKQTLEMIPYITGKRIYAPALENTDLYTDISRQMSEGKDRVTDLYEAYLEAINVSYKNTGSYYGPDATNPLKEVSSLVQSEFSIGFWNYQLGNECTVEDVKLWAECGMTIAMTPHFNYERDDKSAFLDILDACNEYGIKVILCIEGLEYPHAQNEEAYAALCSKVYADFAKHPAVFAVALGDEPGSGAMYTLLSKAIALAKENIPGVEYHVNFLPYYSTLGNDILGGKDYLAFMKRFVKDSGLDLFSYDCYCQMRGNIEGYFTSMKGYSSIAKETGSDWWNTVLITGHRDQLCPDENQIRWQLNTSVASGAKGILWYQFYDSPELENYYGSPIDCFGNTTETYDRLAHVLKTFHMQHGDLLLSLNYKAAYHFGESYGGYSYFPTGVHKQIINMKAPDDLSGIVSFFTDDQGEEYVVIVNNSLDTIGQFTFVLDREQTHGMVRIRENGNALLDCLSNNHSFTVTESATEYQVSFWLNPGQLEVFKLS